jgi:hypothetical protein
MRVRIDVCVFVRVCRSLFDCATRCLGVHWSMYICVYAYPCMCVIVFPVLYIRTYLSIYRTYLSIYHTHVCALTVQAMFGDTLTHAPAHMEQLWMHGRG